MAKTYKEDRGDEYMLRLAYDGLRLWAWLDQIGVEEMADGVAVTRITVKTPQETGDNWFVIVKGRAGGDNPVVVFGRGESPQSAFADLKQRSEARGLNWRDDPPWEGRTG